MRTTFRHRPESSVQPLQVGWRTNVARALGLTLGLAVFAGAAIWSNLPAFAQNKIDREQAERKLRDRIKELDSKSEKASQLKYGVGQIELESKNINKRLQNTAALIKRSEARMTDIELRISELEEQERLVRGSLSQRHGEISKLLGALQRMGRNPPPVMVTRREDALKMVRSAMLLSAAFPSLRKQALALSTRLNNLVRVMDDIRTEGTKLKAETEKLNAARVRLAGVMRVKKQTLLERQTELKKVREATALIERNVSDLNELIVKLDSNVERNTRLGQYDAELKKQREAGGNGERSKIPKAIAEVSPPKEKGDKVAVIVPPNRDQIIEIAPPSNGLGMGNPERITPAIPFYRTRGQLPLPASGRRIISFGEKTQSGSRSKGMVLETRFAAQITSPSDGWVVYAGKFRSYGKLLIINAGDGYHILLAGLSNIDVEPGQFVLAAEPVGTMSSPNSGQTNASNETSPVLYIEFRKGGSPINPDPWWVASHQKAS